MGKNLIIITSAFPFKSDYRGSFIKSQIKYVQKEFNNIYVISPLSYFPNYFLNLKRFRAYSGYKEYPRNYSYDNVKVFFPKYLSMPNQGDFFLRLRGPLNNFCVNHIVKKYNITFDIIHSHFIFPAGLAGVDLKSKYNKPLVLTAHGGDIYKDPFKNDEWFYLTKGILNECDKIITTSERNYEILDKELSIKSSKLSIINNGFDDTIFKIMNQNSVRDLLGIPKHIKLIISIGNLINIKGHRYLIDAMKSVASKNKDVFCVIIGNGHKANLQLQIEKHGLCKYIKIIEGVPHDVVPLWMNACDLFVLPSLDEGFPTVIPEALGCGKPVVATAVGGIPDIITDKAFGLLVEPGNAKDIARNILLALEMDWDNKRIREYARGHYTWKSNSKRLLELYASLC